MPWWGGPSSVRCNDCRPHGYPSARASGSLLSALSRSTAGGAADLCRRPLPLKIDSCRCHCAMANGHSKERPRGTKALPFFTLGDLIFMPFLEWRLVWELRLVLTLPLLVLLSSLSQK